MMKFYQRWLRAVSFLFLGLAILTPCLTPAAPSPDLVIDAKMYPLGKRPNQPDRARLDVPFQAAPNATEFALQLSYQSVIRPWFVEVNGRRLGQIPFSYRLPGSTYFTIPAGTLVAGTNTLSIIGEDLSREPSVGNFLLFRKPLRELLKLRTVTITVTDDATGQPMPARVSILNDRGAGAEIFHASTTNIAIRPGFIYTTGAKTTFEIAEGKYDFYATRGMEWSLARKTISVSGSQPALELRLRREVDTKGFVAADTHIHNVTFSGHGDATIDERMISLAGEGVELAVASDHNHFTDYTPFQSRLKLEPYFTPVVGNELTTKNGHFITFPMPLGGRVPDHREYDWVKLMADARLCGAQVIIWNHPYYPSLTDSPYSRFRFNYASGDRFNGPAFNFNAMELVNSSSGGTVNRPAIREDPSNLMQEWFILLNRGEKITGVGSSDSHTAENPVGQGRTYLRSSTDDAARINQDEMVRSFLAGDSVVSYGIFADVKVNGRQHMGEHVKPSRGKVDVDVRVASASWIKPRHLVLFLNGLPVAEKVLNPTADNAFDQHATFSLPLPKHDTYLVCAVFGDGITAPYWKMVGKFTAAISNPIYIDGNGDGKYQTPRETAQLKLDATDGTLKTIWPLVEKFDDSLAGQMLGVLYLTRDADFVRQLDNLVRTAAPKRELYRKFLENSPLIVVKTKPGKFGKAKAKPASN